MVPIVYAPYVGLEVSCSRISGVALPLWCFAGLIR